MRVKATNPDNRAELRSLIALFTKNWGNTYPISAVYSENFWQERLGTQYLSVVAMRRHNVVAHIAVRLDEQFPSDAHLCMVAFDPEYQDQMSELARQLWAHLMLSPYSKTWSSRCAATVPGCPVVDKFVASLVSPSCAAILPEYLNPIDDQSVERRPVQLCVERVQPLKAPEVAKLRIPERYRPLAQSQFLRFGLTPQFSAGARDAQALSADAQAVLRYRYAGWGTEHLFIVPSLVASWDEIEISDRLRSVLFIDTRDVLCPDMCQQAESHGYVFCGFLPFMCGRHSIVYAQRPTAVLDTDSFSTQGSDLVIAEINSSLQDGIEAPLVPRSVRFA